METNLNVTTASLGLNGAWGRLGGTQRDATDIWNSPAGDEELVVNLIEIPRQWWTEVTATPQISFAYVWLNGTPPGPLMP